MYAGKLVFAQLMEHLQLYTFRRLVDRHGGGAEGEVVFVPGSVSVHGVRATDLSRESLRAQRLKLYYLGIRSTIARLLCINKPFGVDLKESVDVLDTTTIDLCVCWCFRGRHFGGPGRRSNCIRCSICATTSRLSFTSAMASCTRSTSLISCWPSLAHFT